MRTERVLLGLTLLLAACGQKGPLYLPDKKPPAVTAPAQPAAAAPAAAPAAPKKPTDEDDGQTPAPK
jgi:predicted small lipoprotein YifL